MVVSTLSVVVSISSENEVLKVAIFVVSLPLLFIIQIM